MILISLLIPDTQGLTGRRVAVNKVVSKLSKKLWIYKKCFKINNSKSAHFEIIFFHNKYCQRLIQADEK